MFNYGLENPQNLRRAIISVIAFFDLFEYPLSAFEIWKYLDRRIDFSEIFEALNKELAALSPVIENKRGFYFLRGREHNIITRQKRYNYANQKIKIARRFSRIFSFWPFIQLIAVSNLVGDHNLRDESDIDFFIIISAKRIWLSRFFCAGFAKLLNSRPRANNKKNKICLSFYITENNLNLDKLKLENDPYFDYWIRGLFLLYNKKDIYNKFLSANGLACSKQEEPKISANWLLDMLEIIARKIQLYIMPEELKVMINKSKGVYIGDNILKLHLHDKRQEFFNKYISKINEIL